MKTIFSVLAAAIVVVSAKHPEVQVELYEDASCDGTRIADHKIKKGHCQKMDRTLTVDTPELKEAYAYYKLSGDDFNEIYVFPNHDSCKAYGDDFDQEKEVTFIRAPGRDKCYECTKCGSAKSIRFTTPVEKEDKPKADEPAKDINAAEDDSTGDNTASGIVASSLVVFVAAAASMVF